MTAKSRIIIALMGTLASAVPAGAASWFELNFGLSGPRYDALVPLCHDASVLSKLSSRFSEKEGEFWNSNLEIIDFGRIKQVAFRPWQGASQSIPRRFCNGLVKVSDGSTHQVHYSILETSGWLGVGWGVEFCVVGLDRNWAFNPSCRMARP